MSYAMPVIPRQSISPEGGQSEQVSIRFPRGWGARIDQIARHRGMTKSELIRAALEPVIATEDTPQEDTKAS